MQEAQIRAMMGSRNDRSLNEISQSSADHYRHSREDSISRMLGKQQSEARLIEAVKAK